MSDVPQLSNLNLGSGTYTEEVCFLAVTMVLILSVILVPAWLSLVFIMRYEVRGGVVRGWSDAVSVCFGVGVQFGSRILVKPNVAICGTQIDCHGWWFAYQRSKKVFYLTAWYFAQPYAALHLPPIVHGLLNAVCKLHIRDFCRVFYHHFTTQLHTAPSR